MKNIKILFILHYPGMYGANLSLCSLLTDLKDNYAITPVILLAKQGPVCRFLEDKQIEYIIAPFYWWVNAEHGLFKYALNVRKQVLNYVRLPSILAKLAGHKIDLVYTNSITVNIGYFAGSRLNCPHIWHLREGMQAYHFKFSLTAWFARHFLAYAADRYILISDYLRGQYTSLLPADRVVRIYNGVSLDQPAVFRTSLDMVNICLVGVICEQKNQLDALRAVLILKNKGITNFRLHFVGSSNADYLDKVRQFIDDHQLQDVCCFHGHQAQAISLLATMDLGLMTSRDEGFGRVSIEYMLQGMPVIASRSGANPELIREGKNGYLYELYNPVELADRIDYFLKEPGHMREMGEWASDYAKTQFSREQNTRAIYEVIRNTLSPE